MRRNDAATYRRRIGALTCDWTNKNTAKIGPWRERVPSDRPGVSHYGVRGEAIGAVAGRSAGLKGAGRWRWARGFSDLDDCRFQSGVLHSVTMNETTEPNPNPPTPNPSAPRMLPEEFSIPFQLIEKWVSIPDHTYLNLRLTRRDLDKLYNSINKMNTALYATNSSLIAWSNGNLENANEAMLDSQRALIESQNNLKQLFMALMVEATGGNSASGT